jgi:UDP-N-acetylmuramoyl-L-alanyl-D-glutamate--2,6-diaminopimelate ligase
MLSPSKTLDAVAQIISAQSATQSFELKNILITGVSQSSENIEEGDIFIALPGDKTHGARFAADAIKNGARAVLTDSAGAELIILAEVQAYSAHGFIVNLCVICIAWV